MTWSLASVACESFLEEIRGVETSAQAMWETCMSMAVLPLVLRLVEKECRKREMAQDNRWTRRPIVPVIHCDLISTSMTCTVRGEWLCLNVFAIDDR